MPLMIGHTWGESTLFTIFNPRFRDLERPRLLELVSSVFPDSASVALGCYEEDRAVAGLGTDPIDIWAAISTDRMFRIPAIRTSQAHSEHTSDVWMYRFDHESPAHSGRLHSCHSLDIPFVWDTYDGEKMRRFCGEDHHIANLSSRMMESYIAFAHHGNPNTELPGSWDPYGEARSTMCFDSICQTTEAPLDETRQLWMDD